MENPEPPHKILKREQKKEAERKEFIMLHMKVLVFYMALVGFAYANAKITFMKWGYKLLVTLCVKIFIPLAVYGLDTAIFTLPEIPVIVQVTKQHLYRRVEVALQAGTILLVIAGGTLAVIDGMVPNGKENRQEMVFWLPFTLVVSLGFLVVFGVSYKVLTLRSQ